MSGLFGKGGKEVPDFAKNTEPMPLDLDVDRVELVNSLNRPPTSSRPTPSFNRGGSSNMYNSSTRERHNVDTVNDFSDMTTTDEVKDKDITDLRKYGYMLSNKEREDNMRHRNDFNNIVKIVIICFSLIVGFAFMLLVGIIAYTSVKSGSMTETGIIGSILQFIADVMKIGLS